MFSRRKKLCREEEEQVDQLLIEVVTDLRTLLVSVIFYLFFFYFNCHAEAFKKTRAEKRRPTVNVRPAFFYVWKYHDCAKFHQLDIYPRFLCPGQISHVKLFAKLTFRDGAVICFREKIRELVLHVKTSKELQQQKQSKQQQTELCRRRVLMRL